MSNFSKTFPIGLCPPLAEMDVSSPFGMRVHPIGKIRGLHPGVDFRCADGTPVYAAADGQVTRSYLSVGDPQKGTSGYGERIVIMHAGGAETSYAHLSKRLVAVGDAVRAGQLIGLSGNTGASTGPHLHFELKIDGRAVNPMPQFN